MPIIYQHNINEHTRLAVWHITEPESFFLQRVPLKKEVSHPHKRLQHLAGRWLLPSLFSDFPLDAIQVADTRRPFLENDQYHFSISHCADYAAAIVSSRQRVGVDIETVTPKIDRVSHKFAGPEEWVFLAEPGQPTPASPAASLRRPMDSRLLTLLWSAKEVIFKWYGSGQLDFKAHMRLSGYPVPVGDGWLELPFLFSRNGAIPLSVQGRFIGQTALSWTATEPLIPHLVQ